MVEKIEVLAHSSIRIGGKVIVYIDPFQIPDEPKDADIILITHEHPEHFSLDDIKKVVKENTKIVIPQKMKKKVSKNNENWNIIEVEPGIYKEFGGVEIETVAAYNNMKHFHPKRNGWLGYIIIINDTRIYIAGDTDITKENKKVRCDIALVPIGGGSTMDAKKAAELVNIINPQIAIPTHYGSVVGKMEDVNIFKNNVNPYIKVVIKIKSA